MRGSVLKCPESVEELEELERMIPLCRRELYEQAQARVSSGKARSIRDASIQLGKELDRNPESIRVSIEREKQTQSCNTVTTPHFRTQFTGENEWFTPQRYIDLAQHVLGEIDLDPATHPKAQERIKAKTFYTAEDNALMKEWNGRVWLNPPFSQPLISDFIDKLLLEYRAKRTTEAILLTHNYTDTKWFHKAENEAVRLCFTLGRIQFERIDDQLAQPTQGQVFFYYGEHSEAFKEVFRKIGFIR